jgi:hypothetical protein
MAIGLIGKLAGVIVPRRLGVLKRRGILLAITQFLSLIMSSVAALVRLEALAGPAREPYGFWEER